MALVVALADIIQTVDKSIGECGVGFGGWGGVGPLVGLVLYLLSGASTILRRFVILSLLHRGHLRSAQDACSV